MDEAQSDLVLYVFNCIKEIHGKTFIQKLFFILMNQVKEIPQFEYFPYNYGPFSKELNQAVNDLIEEGYISETKVGEYFLYSITDKGSKVAEDQKTVNKDAKKQISQVCEHVKNLRPRELLEYVYKKYPESTVNSLLKREIFKS